MKYLDLIACVVIGAAVTLAIQAMNAPTLDHGKVVEQRKGRGLFGRTIHLIVVEGKTADGRFAQHVIETDSTFNGYAAGDRWMRNF